MLLIQASFVCPAENLSWHQQKCALTSAKLGLNDMLFLGMLNEYPEFLFLADWVQFKFKFQVKKKCEGNRLENLKIFGVWIFKNNAHGLLFINCLRINQPQESKCTKYVWEIPESDAAFKLGKLKAFVQGKYFPYLAASSAILSTEKGI